jgi:hypothetical protein
MQIAPTRSDPAYAPQASPRTACYSVLGVPIAITSDIPEALLHVDESYSAFRAAPGARDGAVALSIRRGNSAFVVSDAAEERRWAAYQDALLDLLDRLVHALLARLLARGIVVFHAAALTYRGGALIVAGRSGQGKTTLALGLLRRGLGLLSDEFAVVEPTTRQILPYRRGLHVRPGTPELIPELRFLWDRPRYERGGGSEWAVAPHDLEQALPGCLGRPAPLCGVLLLDGAPRPSIDPEIVAVPAALAALELLRGAWAASVDFAGTLAQTGRLLGGVSCARLRAGAFEPTLDAILAWQEAYCG